MSTAMPISTDNVMLVSRAAGKPSSQTRVIRVPVPRTVAEAAKWQIPNTQLVVSYSEDSGFCAEDCGGFSKVANAEHTACGKLHW